MSNQPRGAPIPSLLTDLQKFVYSVPPVTRYLVFGTLVFSLSAQIGLCKAHQLMLSFSDLTQSFEIWRLCTAHLFSSGPNMIWHLYMLYQNSRSLEDGYYSTRPADYAFFIILVMSVLDVIGLFFGYPLLTESFGMAITYMYAMSRGDEIVTFMFGMQFKAMYLPWVLIVFNMVMGGGVFMSLIGVAVGHLYYFVEVVYPQQNGGTKILVTPTLITNLYGPPPNVMGASGSIPNMGNTGRSAAFTRQTSSSQSSSQTSGYRWGSGNRLGSE